MFALEFPPINAILRWKDLFPTFNKVALIAVAAALIGIIIFLLAGNRDGTKPPKGVRNLAEIIVEFIEDQIVMPTMGRAACAGHRSSSACSSSSTCATPQASSRSSTCRPRHASPSRCASACWCG